MKKLLLMSCFCVFAVPAFAEPSLQELIEKTVGPAQRAAKAEEAKREVKPKPAAKKTVSAKPAVKARAKPKPKPASKPKVKRKPQVSGKSRPAPVRNLKPYVPKPDAPSAEAVARGFVTQSEALDIALSVAPPVRDFVIRARDDVYAAEFKAERGLYEVLVDKASGGVVSQGYLQGESVASKPGHLPAR